MQDIGLFGRKTTMRGRSRICSLLQSGPEERTWWAGS